MISKYSDTYTFETNNCKVRSLRNITVKSGQSTNDSAWELFYLHPNLVNVMHVMSIMSCTVSIHDVTNILLEILSIHDIAVRLYSFKSSDNTKSIPS